MRRMLCYYIMLCYPSIQPHKPVYHPVHIPSGKIHSINGHDKPLTAQRILQGISKIRRSHPRRAAYEQFNGPAFRQGRNIQFVFPLLLFHKKVKESLDIISGAFRLPHLEMEIKRNAHTHRLSRRTCDCCRSSKSARPFLSFSAYPGHKSG